ncbi:hypothetical protein LMTR3_20040 [Bradyrhizobium sp. LMTR 3]|nr:hypothetical protein LMTR3_20040 [Bradyrhizobium sp. LMTR 3]
MGRRTIQIARKKVQEIRKCVLTLSRSVRRYFRLIGVKSDKALISVVSRPVCYDGQVPEVVCRRRTFGAQTEEILKELG